MAIKMDRKGYYLTRYVHSGIVYGGMWILRWIEI